MKRVYTTANGRRINIDSVIAQHEETIAVGNMKVNARGDQLGAGGKVDSNRNKILSDYYKLNTPVATNSVPETKNKEIKKDLVDEWLEPSNTVETSDKIVPEEDKQSLRGSLADSIAKLKVNTHQEPKKKNPTRI